jgi:hypothetical protein
MTLVFDTTVGLAMTIETSLDLTSSSSYQLYIVKPDGTTAMWTPTCATLTSGELHYTTVTGDLDQPGDYYLQAYAEFPATGAPTGCFYGDVVKFRVSEKAIEKIDRMLLSTSNSYDLFYNLIMSKSSITYSATAPANPAVGDVWYQP